MKDDKYNDVDNNHQYISFPAMNAGVSPDKSYNDAKLELPLCLACTSGDLELVRILMDKGHDINKKDGSNLTPIMHAALNGHKTIIKLLADNGAKISYALLGIVKAKMNTAEKEVLYGKVDSYEITLWRNLLDFLIDEGKKQ